MPDNQQHEINRKILEILAVNGVKAVVCAVYLAMVNGAMLSALLFLIATDLVTAIILRAKKQWQQKDDGGSD